MVIDPEDEAKKEKHPFYKIEKGKDSKVFKMFTAHQLSDLMEIKKELEDDKTLQDYDLDKNVFTGAILLLVDIEINVIPSGSANPLKVTIHPTDSIDFLKNKLADLYLKCDPYDINIIFYGRKLTGSREIKDYGIVHDSILYVGISSNRLGNQGQTFKSSHYEPTLSYTNRKYGKEQMFENSLVLSGNIQQYTNMKNSNTKFSQLPIISQERLELIYD